MASIYESFSIESLNEMAPHLNIIGNTFVNIRINSLALFFSSFRLITGFCDC